MNHRVSLVALILVAAFASAACAALQPPSATGPRGSEQLYPVLLTVDSHRKEAIESALNRLAQQNGGNPASLASQLRPDTSTTLSFSSDNNLNLYLPKVGAGAVMNEEETRESLRRFIKEWQELIGSDPAKLSLVDRVDQPDGSKLALYEQRPFRYPIRGNYGKLQIRFTADRRVLNLTSSCIPNAEQVQTSLSALTGRLRSAAIVQQLRERGLSYTNPQGTKVDLKLPTGAVVNPRSLVVYVLPATAGDGLEIHLAFEIELTNGPLKVAYIDALNGETIAVE